MKCVAIIGTISALYLAGCETVAERQARDAALENGALHGTVTDSEGNKTGEFIWRPTFNTTMELTGGASESVKHCETYARFRYVSDGWIEACDAALADPETSDENRLITRYNRGLVLFNAQRADEARADFDAVLETNPEFGDAWLALATLDANNQAYDEAMPSVEKAIAFGVSHLHEAHHVQGWVFEKTYRFQDARAAYNKALELNPRSISAKRSLQRLDRLWPSAVKASR